MINIEELKSKIHLILAGIDYTESDHENGWWETSTGAEFGKRKLDEIICAIDECT